MRLENYKKKDKDNKRWLKKLNYANRNDKENFKINDRVRILNIILHPGTDDNNDTARNVTVVKVKLIREEIHWSTLR